MVVRSPHLPSARAALAAAAALAVLSGCFLPPPAGMAPAAGGVGGIVGPAGAPVGSAGTATAGLGVYGRATSTAPFADAEVRLIRLDDDQPVGAGRTDADGRFSIAVAGDVAPGTPLRITASRDGKTLGALGTVAERPAGSARWGLLQRPASTAVEVTPASTLALLAFMKRMKAVAIAITIPGTKRISFEALPILLEAYQQALVAAQQTIAKYGATKTTSGKTVVDDIMSSMGADGGGTLSAETASIVTQADSPLIPAITQVSNTLNQAAAVGTSVTGAAPPPDLTATETLGQAQLPALTPATAPTTTAPAAATPPLSPQTVSTPRSGGGGSTAAAPPPAATPGPGVPVAFTGNLAAGLPAATGGTGAAIGFSTSLGLPAGAGPAGGTVTLGVGGLPTAGAAGSTSLGLDVTPGVPTQAMPAGTRTVELAPADGQPAATGVGGTSLSFGSAVGVPAPAPTPTPSPAP